MLVTQYSIFCGPQNFHPLWAVDTPPPHIRPEYLHPAQCNILAIDESSSAQGWSRCITESVVISCILSSQSDTGPQQYSSSDRRRWTRRFYHGLILACELRIKNENSLYLLYLYPFIWLFPLSLPTTAGRSLLGGYNAPGMCHNPCHSWSHARVAGATTMKYYLQIEPELHSRTPNRWLR